MTMQAAGRRPEPPAARPESRRVTASRVTPSQAIVSRPMLVALPILVLLIPSIAIALARQPVYTAEARLLIGGFNVEAQRVPGFVEASRTLAETYSRLVPTRAISERVAKILDVDVEEVEGHIEASSVPDSSLIRVEGTASSVAKAVKLSAAASQALVDFADQSEGGSADELLDQYRQASLALNEATAARDALQARYDARVAAGTATDADRSAVSAAQADVDRAKLEATTLAGVYTTTRSNTGTSGQVTLVAPARDVGSDKKSTLQLAIAGPLLLGAIAGVALATIVANRRREMAPAHAAG
jgi:hypothetical protein